MTRIESETKIIEQNIDKVYHFLEDINNLEKLMPDRVENWQSTRDNCYFSIKGTASLGMKVDERTHLEQIKLVHDGKVPFPFDFYMNMKEVNDNSSAVMFVFDADLNPMLKMMAVNPLKNFLNMLLDKMAEIEL